MRINRINTGSQAMLQIFNNNDPFTLESGIILSHYHLAFTTYGKLNENGDNVVWIFHALTANSLAEEWWPGLVGPDKIFDPLKYFIVCVNMPGSCYGSISPLDQMPSLQKSNNQDVNNGCWFHTFPFFTTRDMVRAYQPLKDYLGIEKIFAGIGGSMGGQQLLEWAIEEPELFEFIFPIATNAFHSPWGIAFNASQRLCIESDATWNTDDPKAGMNGMKVARSVALISYRNYETYQHSQFESHNEKLVNFKSDSYQRYQGEKLAKRFNAFSYYTLSQSMDSHNVGRGRGSAEQALKRVQAKTLVMGIKTDILFPPVEQQYIAAHIRGAEFKLLNSMYGHDGFLLEYKQISKFITSFITKLEATGNPPVQTTKYHL